ncbi:M3 family metallopeptidase [Thiotrichales bacterium 19S9-12]|nr:M3 family metallopeptidase [Thiotrichales bacterium 19S9-11]MCF6811372.1 M3 family metallopeptidase [Thiotrichales bacterium 19S9-12]
MNIATMDKTELSEIIELPKYSQINIQLIEDQIKDQIQACQDLRETLLEKNITYTWDNLILPMDVEEDKLDKLFAPISQLNAVLNNDQLREVYDRCIVKLSEYATEVSQHEGLYNAYLQIQQSEAFKNEFNATQRRIIEEALKGFKLSGVHLPKNKKDDFKKISEQLTTLSTKFSNNVLDATNSWYFHTDSLDDLKGLPDYVIDMAKQKAKAKGMTGYALGLDQPTLIAVMTSADNRELRETCYKEYGTRASDQGANANKWDNSDIIRETLSLRQKKADILNYDNYAELSIATKMVESTDQVMDFLYDLVKRTKTQALEEFEELALFAKEMDQIELASWDVNYYAEKLKKERFSFTQEELRPYFPVNHVLKGLFSILNEIYGLKVEKIDQFDRYHDTVSLYQFVDKDDQLRGLIYIDLYARESKRGGAWMDDITTRYVRDDKKLQVPVAYLACNFAPPLDKDTQALLTHNDVVTLFHEFGHALHHILTKVNYLPVSGIHGVEWDAVELPSQFMENYTWHKDGLKRITEHYQTGESLPEALFDKLVASRYFQSAMQMLRQLEFAIFDFKLHLEYKKHQDDPNYVLDLLDQVRQEVAVVMPPKYHRFTHSFSHIFAGGYAAGYYSYKWAEVLSSDAFALFEESGDVFNRDIGLQFLEQVLEKGSSAPALDLFTNYRGRKPDIKALLRHSGIQTND